MKSNNHLSVETVVEKNKIASNTPFLVLLEFDVIDPVTDAFVETVYLINNDEDVDYQGQTYAAINFALDLKKESGAQPTVTLTVEDITGAIKTRMEQYGGGVGFDARIVVVNTSDMTLEPEIVENFTVVGASVNDYSVSWTLGTESHLTINFPPRRQLRDRCPWEYKDADTCKYSGAMTSCDFTLDGANGCSVHGNEINFGGYPGLVTR